MGMWRGKIRYGQCQGQGRGQGGGEGLSLPRVGSLRRSKIVW